MAESSGQTESSVSVTLVPRRSLFRRMFNVTSHQSRGYSGVLSAIPHLSVSNILPASSPVFSIIRNGRLEELQMMLNTGKASLRDHDEYGASFLHVSKAIR